MSSAIKANKQAEIDEDPRLINWKKMKSEQHKQVKHIQKQTKKRCNQMLMNRRKYAENYCSSFIRTYGTKLVRPKSQYFWRIGQFLNPDECSLQVTLTNIEQGQRKKYVEYVCYNLNIISQLPITIDKLATQDLDGHTVDSKSQSNVTENVCDKCLVVRGRSMYKTPSIIKKPVETVSQLEAVRSISRRTVPDAPSNVALEAGPKMKIGNRCLRYLQSNQMPKADIVVRIQLDTTTNSICSRYLPLVNMSKCRIKYWWRRPWQRADHKNEENSNEKLEHSDNLCLQDNHLMNRYVYNKPSKFYLDTSDGCLNAYETKHVQVLLHSSTSCCCAESWLLITEPVMEDSHGGIVVQLYGIVTPCDSQGTQQLHADIERRVSKRVASYMLIELLNNVWHNIENNQQQQHDTHCDDHMTNEEQTDSHKSEIAISKTEQKYRQEQQAFSDEQVFKSVNPGLNFNAYQVGRLERVALQLACFKSNQTYEEDNDVISKEHPTLRSRHNYSVATLKQAVLSTVNWHGNRSMLLARQNNWLDEINQCVYDLRSDKKMTVDSTKLVNTQPVSSRSEDDVDFRELSSVFSYTMHRFEHISQALNWYMYTVTHACTHEPQARLSMYSAAEESSRSRSYLDPASRLRERAMSSKRSGRYGRRPEDKRRRRQSNMTSLSLYDVTVVEQYKACYHTALGAILRSLLDECVEQMVNKLDHIRTGRDAFHIETT